MVNDTQHDLPFAVEYGLSDFDGATLFSETIGGVSVANESQKVGVVPLSLSQGKERTTFFWALLHDGKGIVDWERHFLVRFKDLLLPKSAVSMKLVEDDKQRFIELWAPHFTWSVEIELPQGFFPEDNYFDLFPGKKRRIKIKGQGPLKEEDIRVPGITHRGGVFAPFLFLGF